MSLRDELNDGRDDNQAKDIAAIRSLLEAIARKLGAVVPFDLRLPSNPEAMAEFQRKWEEAREAEIARAWEARQAAGKTDEMDDDDAQEFGSAWMG